MEETIWQPFFEIKDVGNEFDKDTKIIYEVEAPVLLKVVGLIIAGSREFIVDAANVFAIVEFFLEDEKRTYDIVAVSVKRFLENEVAPNVYEIKFAFPVTALKGNKLKVVVSELQNKKYLVSQKFTISMNTYIRKKDYLELGGKL